MKKIYIILLIVAFVFPLIAKESSVALALKVNGDVELNRAENTSFLSLGQQLFNNDIITTGEDSFTAIKFIDGSSLLKLFPQSVLVIDSEKKDKKLNKKNKLNLGELWSKVTRNTGAYELETPTTVVSVKGTEFIVSVNDKGHTYLYTLEGKVNIRNKADGNSEDIEAGYKAFSSGNGEIIVSEYDPEELPVDDTESDTMEIHLRNDEGDEKTIRIELE